LTKQYNESLQHYKLPEFASDWGHIRRGIEKECLRVTPEGGISQNPHPAALGSALTNPYITTDFAEALLEFITPAYADIDECLGMLENIHRFSLQNLENDELLWVSSMPCPLSSEAVIRIAEYGSSNIGTMKNLYRRGLHHRYGSLMQTISGLHYNFSMPDSFWEPYQKICGDQQSLRDFRTDKYLHLIRNFHRYSWLLLYLFGASPAACKCFVQGREHHLQELDKGSLYLPDATCLRMGNLGYKSEAQKSLFVCYNELESYVDCLYKAMHTAYPEYEKIGTDPDGAYRQINPNLLQLENEFYSTIRPKRTVASGERPLTALINRGIEYVEVRALDLNPYLPLGIDEEEVRFLDSFLLHCLLADSPECDQREYFEVASNLAATVENGRNPELQLTVESRPIKLREWASEILDKVEYASTLLDSKAGGNSYGEALRAQQAKVENSDRTPSGRMLIDMKENNQSFFRFAMERSMATRDYLKNDGLSAETRSEFEAASVVSLAKQKEIEAADTQSFDEFLREWNKS